MDPHFLLFLLIPLVALFFRNTSVVFLFVSTSVSAVVVASLGLAGLQEHRPLAASTILLTVLLEAALSRPPLYPYIAVQTLLSLLSTFLPSILPPLLVPSLALPFPVLLIFLFFHQSFSRPSHPSQFLPLPLPLTLVIASQLCALLSSLFLLLRETHPHDIRSHVYLPLQSLFLVLCAAFTMSTIALYPHHRAPSHTSPPPHVSSSPLTASTTTGPSYHYRKPSQRHYTLRRSLPAAALDIDADCGDVPLTTLPPRIKSSQTRIPRLQRQRTQRPRPPTPPPLPPSPPKQRRQSQQHQQIRDLLFYSPSQRGSPSKNRKYPRYPPLPGADGVTSYSSTTGLLGENGDGGQNDVGLGGDAAVERARVGGSGIDSLPVPARVRTPPKLEGRIPQRVEVLIHPSPSSKYTSTNEYGEDDREDEDIDYSRSIYPPTSEGCGGSDSSEETVSPVSPISPTINISPASEIIGSPVNKAYTGASPTKPKPVYERKFTHKLTRSKSDIYPRLQYGSQYGYWLGDVGRGGGEGDATPTSPTSPISPISPTSPTSPTSPISPLSPTMPITPNTLNTPYHPYPHPYFQAPSTYSPSSLGFEFTDSQTRLGLGFEFGETGLGLGDSLSRSVGVGMVGLGVKKAVSEGGHAHGRRGGDGEVYAARLERVDSGALGGLGGLGRNNHDQNMDEEERKNNRGNIRKNEDNDEKSKKGVYRYKHRSSPAIHIRAPLETNPPTITSNSINTPSTPNIEATNISTTAIPAENATTATTSTNISSLRRWSLSALSVLRPSLRGSGSRGNGRSRWRVGFGYSGGGGANANVQASTSASALTSRGSGGRGDVIEEKREGRHGREQEDGAREAGGGEWGYGILGDDGFGGGRVDELPNSKGQHNTSSRQSTRLTHLALGRQITLPIHSQTSKLSLLAPSSHHHHREPQREQRRRTPTPNQSVNVSEDFTSLRDPFAPGPVRVRASTFGVGLGGNNAQESGNALGGGGGGSKSAPPSPRSFKSNGSGSGGGSPGRAPRGTRRRGGGVGAGVERRGRERTVSGGPQAGGCAIHRLGGGLSASSSTLNVATTAGGGTRAGAGMGTGTGSLKIWGWGVVPIPQGIGGTQGRGSCTCPSSPLALGRRVNRDRDGNGGVERTGDEDEVSREEREDAVLADLLWRRLTRDEGL